MAEADTTVPNAALSGIDVAAGARQLLLLVGLAAAVAIGVAAVLWLQQPEHKVLFPSVDPAEVAPISNALEGADIDYRYDAQTGAITVAAGALSRARLLLAGQGLPQSRGVSVESLYEGSGYSTSQFMESKFYTHALENKLAGVISELNAVKSAAVTLGLPRQSAFVRDRTPPTASVVVKLFPGRTLERNQVQAIVHLVASSVPELAANNVTILDQNSAMLSGNSRDPLGAANEEFEFKRRLERDLAANVDALLAPILGQGRSRTTVVAQLDFAETESTAERFDPASQVVRSEQSQESETSGERAALGVPGALTNQPPTASVGDVVNGTEPAPPPREVRSSRDSVRNYEVDRVISRTKASRGGIERLSVAVVLDYVPAPAPATASAGTEAEETAADSAEEDAAAAVPEAVPLSEEQLDEIRSVIQDAVGFDAARGDTVNLINVPFFKAEAPEEAQAPPLWEQPWVVDAAKLVVALIVLLALVFLVVRPLINGLLSAHQAAVTARLSPVGGAAALPPGTQATVTDGGMLEVVAPPRQDPLLLAQDLASNDPKRVAQVVKEWVAADD
ncbi:MAG: flagellar basal-body MS-ring/collar protein FliF [Pseudomonadota bacterium]